jgi:DnaJ-class molecular chaperone
MTKEEATELLLVYKHQECKCTGCKGVGTKVVAVHNEDAGWYTSRVRCPECSGAGRRVGPSALYLEACKVLGVEPVR